MSQTTFTACPLAAATPLLQLPYFTVTVKQPVQGAVAWIGGEPYISEAVADAQVGAAPNAQRFVARRSDHPSLVRDPESEMVERIKEFTRAL